MTVQTRDGKVVVQPRERKALETFPPPHDLSDEEREHWTNALADLGATVFRPRNLLILRQYVRLASLLDRICPIEDERRYFRYLRAVTNLARQLSLSVPQEVVRQNLMEARAAIRRREELARQNTLPEETKPANDAAFPPSSSQVRQAFSFTGGRP